MIGVKRGKIVRERETVEDRGCDGGNVRGAKGTRPATKGIKGTGMPERGNITRRRGKEEGGNIERGGSPGGKVAVIRQEEMKRNLFKCVKKENGKG